MVFDPQLTGLPPRAAAATSHAVDSYSTDFFENEAETTLENHVAEYSTVDDAGATTTSTPLFLYLAHQAIHTPAQSHGETFMYNLARFMPETDNQRTKVASAAAELDASVGRLVAKLTEVPGTGVQGKKWSHLLLLLLLLPASSWNPATS